MCSSMDKPKAVTAAAHELARLAVTTGATRDVLPNALKRPAYEPTANKDRMVMLPHSPASALRRQLLAARGTWEADRQVIF